jgi:preprotein translocase subunit YajC
MLNLKLSGKRQFMNREFVNKIIKTIFKILKNFKIKRTNTMPDNNSQPAPAPVVIPSIGANTQIIFTVKSFLATIGSILGLFVGFYFMVVVPKTKDVETHQKELFEQHKEYVSGEFGKINTAIQNNTTTITDLSGRFEDLNTTIENSGGSFGENSTTSHTGEPAVDSSLAVNHQ